MKGSELRCPSCGSLLFNYNTHLAKELMQSNLERSIDLVNLLSPGYSNQGLMDILPYTPESKDFSYASLLGAGLSAGYSSRTKTPLSYSGKSDYNAGDASYSEGCGKSCGNSDYSDSACAA